MHCAMLANASATTGGGGGMRSATRTRAGSSTWCTCSLTSRGSFPLPRGLQTHRSSPALLQSQRPGARMIAAVLAGREMAAQAHGSRISVRRRADARWGGCFSLIRCCSTPFVFRSRGGASDQKEVPWPMRSPSGSFMCECCLLALRVCASTSLTGRCGTRRRLPFSAGSSLLRG